MILSLLFILIFSLIPIVLWGYGVTYLSSSISNQSRFFFGMTSGAFSVGLITLFHRELMIPGWIRIGFIGCLLFLFLIAIWILTQRGSMYIRVFLRKLALFHVCIFFISYWFFFLLGRLMPLSALPLWLFSAFSGFLFSAALEEWMKHLSTLGVSARSFRFSRSDFLIFTLFITLGFILIENLIFFIKALDQWPGVIFQIGSTRILFALLAHSFAASICVVWWWKALSYRIFSLKYSLFFLLWFLLATLAHTLFNIFLAQNFFWGILLFSIVAYMFITRWMLPIEGEVNFSKNG